MTDDMAGVTPSQQVYGQLAEAFAVTHKLPGRGSSGDLEYISGEQCISRLNEVLGFDGWSFRILAHGINTEADEVWVHGRLTVRVQDSDYQQSTICREQFGSEKIKRMRSTGNPVEIGFQLKGATTDALKKCASLIGIGLYLYERDRPASDEEEQPAQRGQARQPQQRQAGGQQPPAKAPATYFTAEDEALEDVAKQNHKPADLAFISWLGRIRQCQGEPACRRLADQIKADKESGKDREAVWTPERDTAVKHLMADQARLIGFKFGNPPGNAAMPRTAPNPGAQRNPAA